MSKIIGDIKFHLGMKFGHFPEEIISVDCETTGLDPKTDCILSIGAVRIRKGKIVMKDQFHKFLKPIKDEVRKQSIAVHLIMPEEANRGIEPEKGIREFFDWAGDVPFLGYNIKFDHDILKRYRKLFLNEKTANKRMELLDIYKMNFPEKTAPADSEFENISRTLNIPPVARHDALNDAITVALMYINLNSR